MATTVNFSEWTREEKDEFAQKRMKEMELFNQKLKQRHDEVEQDRITAEQKNSSVTSSVKTLLKKEKVPEIKEDIPRKPSFEREWDIGKSENTEHWNSPKYGSYHKSSRRGNLDRKSDRREDVWRPSGTSFTDHRKQGYNIDGKKNFPGNSNYKQYESNYQGKPGYKYDNANSPRRSRGRGFRSNAVTYRQSQKPFATEQKRKEYAKTSSGNWKQSGIWSSSSSNSDPEAQTMDNSHIIKPPEKCASLWDAQEISEDQHKQNRVENWVKSVNSAGTWETSEKMFREYSSHNQCKDAEKNYTKNRMYDGTYKQSWDSNCPNIHCKLASSSREAHFTDKSGKNEGQKTIHSSYRTTYQNRGNRSGGSGTYEDSEMLNSRRRNDNRKKNFSDPNKRNRGFKAGAQYDMDVKNPNRYFPDRGGETKEFDSKDFAKENFSKFKMQTKYASDGWNEEKSEQYDDFNKYGKRRFPRPKGQNVHASNDNWDTEENEKFDYNDRKKEKTLWTKFQRHVDHDDARNDRNEQNNSEKFYAQSKRKEFSRPYKKNVGVNSSNFKRPSSPPSHQNVVSHSWGSDVDQKDVKHADREKEIGVHDTWSDIDQEISKPATSSKDVHSGWEVEQEFERSTSHDKYDASSGWEDVKPDSHDEDTCGIWSDVEQETAKPVINDTESEKLHYNEGENLSEPMMQESDAGDDAKSAQDNAQSCSEVVDVNSCDHGDFAKNIPSQNLYSPDNTMAIIDQSTENCILQNTKGFNFGSNKEKGIQEGSSISTADMTNACVQDEKTLHVQLRDVSIENVLQVKMDLLVSSASVMEKRSARIAQGEDSCMTPTQLCKEIAQDNLVEPSSDAQHVERQDESSQFNAKQESSKQHLVGEKQFEMDEEQKVFNLETQLLDVNVKEESSLERCDNCSDNTFSELKDENYACDEIRSDNILVDLQDTTNDEVAKNYDISTEEVNENYYLQSVLDASPNSDLACKNPPVSSSQDNCAKCVKENYENSIDVAEETSLPSAKALIQDSETACALLLSDDANLPIKDIQHETELSDQTAMMKNISECTGEVANTKFDNGPNPLVTSELQFSSNNNAEVLESSKTVHNESLENSYQLSNLKATSSEKASLDELSKSEEQICQENLLDLNNKPDKPDIAEVTNSCHHNLILENDGINDSRTDKAENHSPSSTAQLSKSHESLFEKSQSLSSQNVISPAEFMEKEETLFDSVATAEQKSVSIAVLAQDSGNSCALSLSDDEALSAPTEDIDSNLDGNK